MSKYTYLEDEGNILTVGLKDSAISLAAYDELSELLKKITREYPNHAVRVDLTKMVLISSVVLGAMIFLTEQHKKNLCFVCKEQATKIIYGKFQSQPVKFYSSIEEALENGG